MPTTWVPRRGGCTLPVAFPARPACANCRANCCAAPGLLRRLCLPALFALSLCQLCSPALLVARAPWGLLLSVRGFGRCHTRLRPRWVRAATHWHLSRSHFGGGAGVSSGKNNVTFLFCQVEKNPRHTTAFPIYICKIHGSFLLLLLVCSFWLWPISCHGILSLNRTSD